MRRHLAAVSLLVLAACSQEGADATGSTSVADFEGGALAASSGDALAVLSLSGSGDGRVSFGSVETQGAAHIFSDVTIVTEEGDELHADSIRLVGAALTGDSPTFDAFQITNLSADDKDGSVLIGNIEIIEPNSKVVQFIAAVLSDDVDIEDFDWGQLSDYAFSAVAMEGFAFTGTDGEAVNIGSIRFDGLSEARLGSFSFENLSIVGETDDGGDLTMSLGSWVTNGLNLTGLDAFADLDDDMDPEDMQRALNTSGLTDPFTQHYDDYALNDVVIDIDGVRVVLDSLIGSTRQTRGGLRVTDDMNALTVNFDDSKDLGAQALEGLSMLGYDHIEISLHSEIMADPLTDRLYTQDYELRIADAFSLQFDYDISGVHQYMKNAAKQGVGASLDFDAMYFRELVAPLMLNNFEMRLTDDSAVEHGLQAAATMNNATPDEMREGAIALMTLGSLMAPQGPAQELVQDAITAATSFLQEPGTLRIAINSGEPVALVEVFTALESDDPASALALVNVEIEALPQ